MAAIVATGFATRLDSNSLLDAVNYDPLTLAESDSLALGYSDADIEADIEAEAELDSDIDLESDSDAEGESDLEGNKRSRRRDSGSWTK